MNNPLVVPYLNAAQAFTSIFLLMPVSLRSFFTTMFCIYLVSVILKLLTTRT